MGTETETAKMKKSREEEMMSTVTGTEKMKIKTEEIILKMMMLKISTPNKTTEERERKIITVMKIQINKTTTITTLIAKMN